MHTIEAWAGAKQAMRLRKTGSELHYIYTTGIAGSIFFRSATITLQLEKIEVNTIFIFELIVKIVVNNAMLLPQLLYFAAFAVTNADYRS